MKRYPNHYGYRLRIRGRFIPKKTTSLKNVRQSFKYKYTRKFI